MKTVLVNPHVPDAGTFPSGEFFSCTAPNMGLAYIAAQLEQEGHDVAIVDANAWHMDDAQLQKALHNLAPDIVGVTSTTTTLSDAQRAILAARVACPAAFIVIGGIHATRFPEGTLRECAELDAVSIGEGEHTFVELVEALAPACTQGLPAAVPGTPRELPAALQEKLSAVLGLAFRGADGSIVITGQRPCIEDLDALPLPARHLLPMEYYASAGHPHRTASIVSSRGCPFGCKFCAAPFIAGKRYRARSATSLLDEIGELLERYHMNTFEFVDDLFTLDKKRVFELCEGIRERGWEVNWTCSARADTVTPELLRAMAGAGCRIVYYGVESGSQRILDLIGKRETLDQIAQAIRWTHEASMRSWGFFIIGFPEETHEEIQASIDFACNSYLDYAEFFICSAFPGSPLYERAVAEERVEKEHWSDISYGRANVRSDHIGPAELERYMVRAYRDFYTTPRVMHNLQMYGQSDMVAEIVRQTSEEFERQAVRR